MKFLSSALTLIAVSSKLDIGFSQPEEVEPTTPSSLSPTPSPNVLLRGVSTPSVALASDSGADGLLVSTQARLFALETKDSELEAKHSELEAKHSELEAKHAAVASCIEMEAAEGGGITKVHIKDGCELVVHGHQTVHGHHSIKGGNLFISNGLGSPKCSSSSVDDANNENASTPECSGIGNIIVGYHQDDFKAGHKVITGDHNIVIGEGHTVKSHGGIVSGVNHVATGPHASAIAGSDNTVSGEGAAAVGGANNVASGLAGSTFGGRVCSASGYYAVTSGGHTNKATGSYSSVSGGWTNTASGKSSSILGGKFNEAGPGRDDYNNAETGDWATVAGGKDQHASTENYVCGDEWAGGTFLCHYSDP